ncbi:hypothetical protein [Paraburkholderia sp. J41]|nr:hypothetical protein [Paraburkholderia sp. J41]
MGAAWLRLGGSRLSRGLPPPVIAAIAEIAEIAEIAKLDRAD